jgi:hypothetical protein
MKRLLRTVDPEYANMLKEAGPLPYYALSSVLTAFSHDVPTLPLIQHIFDYILSRPPIVLIYLTAAVRSLCDIDNRFLCFSRSSSVGKMKSRSCS